MKYWEKYGTVGYELLLDDSGFAAGNLYFKESEGGSFVAYIGGRRNEVILTAKTLRGAQKEAERWLIKKYGEEIERHEQIVANLRESVSILKGEENRNVSGDYCRRPGL